MFDEKIMERFEDDGLEGEYVNLFRADNAKRLFDKIKPTVTIPGHGEFGNRTVAYASHLLAKYNGSDVKVYYVFSNTARKDINSTLKLVHPKELGRTIVFPVGFSLAEAEEFKKAIKVIESYERGELNNMNTLKEAQATIVKLARRLRGAGGVFEKGLKLYEMSRDLHEKIIKELMPSIFVNVAGGGGGTGGAGVAMTSKIIAENDKENSSLIINFVMKPEPYEGKVRMENFEKTYRMAKPYSDLFVIFSNYEFPKNITFSQFSQLVTAKMITLIDMFVSTSTDQEYTVRSIDEEDMRTVLDKRGHSIGFPVVVSNNLTFPFDERPNIDKRLGVDELVNKVLVSKIEQSNINPDAALMFFDVPDGVTREVIESAIEKFRDELGLYNIIPGVRERPINAQFDDLKRGSLIQPPQPDEIRVHALLVQYDDNTPTETEFNYSNSKMNSKMLDLDVFDSF